MGVAAAYAELGLQPGAELAEVRRAFRALAREFHPDVCPPGRLAEFGARFVAIKSAYDTIVESGVTGTSGSDQAYNPSMTGFIRNMAGGVGHHKTSDGRLYELWLDLRGQPGKLSNALQETMELFWSTRNIIDDLSASLVKEGYISAVVTDDPSEETSHVADAGGAILPASSAEAARAVGSWDYNWQPLVLVDAASGRARHGKTGAPMGCLKSVAQGKLLGLDADPPSADAPSASAAAAEEIVIVAGDAYEAQKAKGRYGFVMKALLLPPDPAIWATAGTQSVTAEAALSTVERIRQGKVRR